jgi:hypothetical protein
VPLLSCIPRNVRERFLPDQSAITNTDAANAIAPCNCAANDMVWHLSEKSRQPAEPSLRVRVGDHYVLEFAGSGARNVE